MEPPHASLLASGMRTDATAGSVAGGIGATTAFYPLAVGNQWSYRQHVVYTVLSDQDETPAPFEQEATVDRQQICVEPLDGIDYVVEQVTVHQPEIVTVQTWIRLRQDRGGLYEANLAIQNPPVCAGQATSVPSQSPSRAFAATRASLAMMSPERRRAFETAAYRLHERLQLIEAAARGSLAREAPVTGAQFARATELTRLRYPLHVGTGWVITMDPEGPTFAARVEGADVLALPAGHFSGFRIRIVSNLFGPDDEVHVWYGPAGFLQLVVHSELDATDDTGARIGRIAVDQREMLESLSLVRETFRPTLFEGEGLPGRD